MEKFKFDLEFSEDGQARQTRPAVKRAYRPEEVEAERAKARAEGERSAVAQAEQMTAKLMDQLAQSMHQELTVAKFALDEIHDDATRLAGTIARKLVMQAFEAAPESYFERVIDECLNLLHREPEIRVTIPAGSPESLFARLKELAAQHGLENRIRVEASPNLRAASCHVDWQAGGAEISLEDALTRMEAIIAERIAALEALRIANGVPAQRVSA